MKIENLQTKLLPILADAKANTDKCPRTPEVSVISTLGTSWRGELNERQQLGCRKQPVLLLIHQRSLHLLPICPNNKFYNPSNKIVIYLLQAKLYLYVKIVN